MNNQNIRRAVPMALVALVLTLALGACKGTDVVPSGTYDGTVVKVEADKNEIYVESDGKKLELYFTETTELLKGDQKVEFAALEEGQKVKVTIETVGKRLDPKKVIILE